MLTVPTTSATLTGLQPGHVYHFKVRGLTLPNRVVVSPMAQYSCVDGTPDDFYLVHLGSRAHGGAGLVFTEMTDVSREGRISPGCTGMYKPEHVAAWSRIVEFVQGHDGYLVSHEIFMYLFDTAPMCLVQLIFHFFPRGRILRADGSPLGKTESYVNLRDLS